MNERLSHLKLYINLMHRQQGTISSFRDLASRIGLEICKSGKYGQHNLFMGLWIGGVVNVLWGEYGIKWFINRDAILINSKFPKRILMDNDLLAMADSVQVLIQDSKGCPILYCLNEQQPKTVLRMDETIFNIIKPFGLVLDDVLDPDPTFYFEPIQCDVFDEGKMAWQKSQEYDFDKPALIRKRREYFGFDYLIFIAEHKPLVFKVIDNDWMFIAAAYLLNWDIRRIIRFHNNQIRIPMSFRLPAFINRVLLADSSKLEISGSLSFFDVSESVYNAAINYFEN